MSVVRVNGRGAFWGELRMPRVGAWEADFGVSREGSSEITGAVTIAIGTREWEGTAWRSGENKGAVYVRVVGGAGGLSGIVGPRAYQGVPISIPVNDLLGEVGERISPTADAALLGTVVQKWARATQPAGLALANLIAAAGATWRVLPNGTIWIGREAWSPTQLVDYTYLRQAPNAGAMDLFASDPVIFPGEVFRDRRVSVVTHRLEGTQVTTRLLWEEDQASDRLKDGLLSMVRAALPRVDYLASYWCRVVAQNADGSLEIQPDDARIPGLSNVPPRYGVPGVSAKVAAGCRVLLGFASGDPAQPFATVWDGAAPSEIIIGTGANEPVALGSSLRTELDALWTAITAHTHAVTGTLPAGPVAAVAGVAVYAATKQVVASSKVKVAT